MDKNHPAYQALKEKYDRVEEMIQEHSTRQHLLECIIQELPALRNQLQEAGIPVSPNHPVFSLEKEEREKMTKQPVSERLAGVRTLLQLWLSESDK